MKTAVIEVAGLTWANVSDDDILILALGDRFACAAQLSLVLALSVFDVNVWIRSWPTLRDHLERVSDLLIVSPVQLQQSWAAAQYISF